MFCVLRAADECKTAPALSPAEFARDAWDTQDSTGAAFAVFFAFFFFAPSPGPFGPVFFPFFRRLHHPFEVGELLLHVLLALRGLLSASGSASSSSVSPSDNSGSGDSPSSPARFLAAGVLGVSAPRFFGATFARAGDSLDSSDSADAYSRLTMEHVNGRYTYFIKGGASMSSGGSNAGTPVRL